MPPEAAEYTDLVDRIARQHAARSACVDLDDLLSDGYLALHRALVTWEPGRGSTLRTYVCLVVRRAMRAAARREYRYRERLERYSTLR